MGKILEYSSLGAPPADDDLLFLGDYSVDNANPATKRLLISDLNKKRNVDAADANGLKLRDDGGNYGVFIVDGGNVGMGSAIAPGVTDPAYPLDVRSTTDSTIRIEAGTANNAVLRLDQSGTAQAFVGYEHASSLMKVTNSPTLTDDHLTIDTSGNVIVKSDSATIGSNTYSLKANGDFAILDGTYGVKIDASEANIEGIINTGASGPLHLNRGGGEDIWFMYGSGTNIAGKIESGNRHWFIGTPANDAETTHARLHVKEDDSTTSPVLKLNNATTSAARTVVEFAITSGTDQFIVSENGRIGIRDTNAALGSDSVNFSGGKISIGSTTFNRKLNVTDSNNVLSEFSSSNVAGAKVLVRTTGTAGTDASNVHQNAIIGFPFVNSGAVGKVGWLAGSFLKGTNAYFGIHYSDSAFASSSDDANLVFNNTLNNNLFHINTDGDIHVKRNVRADGYFNLSTDTGADPGAGNYCRGRFIQTYSYRYFYAETNQRWTPLFSEPVDLTNNYNHDGSTTPDKSMCSKTPMAGRVTRIDVSFTNSIANNGINAFVYSGADAPAADLSSSNAAYTNTISLGGAVTEGDYTIGYNDFVEASRTHLDFAAGEFLMLAIENDTGNANATVVMTVEFNVPDSLGA